MKRFARTFALLVMVAFGAGCVLSGPNAPSPVLGFAETLLEFDVVPPSWITPDGKAGGIYADHGSRAVAFTFPSLASTGPPRAPLHVEIPNVFRTNSWFRDGVFVQAPASELERAIEIRSVRTDTSLTIDIDANSMGQIHRLDWDRFRKLQAAYLNWLYGQSSCWSFDCFAVDFGHKLHIFWKSHVLREAHFARFAATYLNPSTPIRLPSKSGKPMFAIPVQVRQQLSITWGSQNLSPATTTADGTPNSIGLTYTRTTSGGNTRLQIVSDRGMRLYPATNCRIDGAKEDEPPPGPNDKVALPYPRAFKDHFDWFMPIYNLYDLHNPNLLTAGVRGRRQGSRCSDGVRRAPRYLYLLTPSIYLKPDTPSEIAQFETEGRLAGFVDARDEYQLLTRQFVILACDVSDPRILADEWLRILNAASGADHGRGQCGNYRHGVFSGKSFVELRNRFSIDGRLMEDGVLHTTTIGQAVGPSLGTRINAEGAPGSRPLLDLWRAAPGEQSAPVPRRLLIRFYTTMSDVLDQANVLEGDDIHVISISEMLR